jgi:hypothetical protein
VQPEVADQCGHDVRQRCCRVDETEMRIYKDRMSPEQFAAFDEMTKFELMIHDLERLSLLEKLIQYVSGDTGRYEVGGEMVSIPFGQGGTKISYALTQYGVNFILAVRPKRPSEE